MKSPSSLIALLALLCAPLSFAQGFRPARTVDLVVHTGPGGGSDVLARSDGAEDREPAQTARGSASWRLTAVMERVR